MVGLQTRSAVQAYTQLRSKYGNPSVMLAHDSSPYTGEPRAWLLRLPCYFFCCANRNRQPLSQLRCQLPLHRGAKGVGFYACRVIFQGSQGWWILYHRGRKKHRLFRACALFCLVFDFFAYFRFYSLLFFCLFQSAGFDISEDRINGALNAEL